MPSHANEKCWFGAAGNCCVNVRPATWISSLTSRRLAGTLAGVSGISSARLASRPATWSLQ